MLGAITMCMDSIDLHGPRPSPPYEGVRYSTLMDTVRSAEQPNWGHFDVATNGYQGRHECSKSSISFLRTDQEETVKGLTLAELQ